MGTFSYGNEKFYLNGESIQILSGSIHYFRVVPEYWRDRMEKLKQCGFNAVETYICWNLHERKEGQFDFTGMLDLGKFIDTANELGLLCIIRPGPYICAEWDYGGLPSWLLTKFLRSAEERLPLSVLQRPRPFQNPRLLISRMATATISTVSPAVKTVVPCMQMFRQPLMLPRQRALL